MKPENWKLKRTWIGAAILLRCAYVLMNEYGKNPFKKSLAKDHVFLTGAGSGIGRLMAVEFGKLGCKLSLSDINMTGLNETKAILMKAGVPAANINIFVCDVSKKAQIKAGAQVARAAFGPVTLLVNNAGIVSGKTTLELSEGMIEKTMQVNTIALLHTIQEFLPDMITGKRGHIVTIASMAGLTSVPGLSDYCASKHGAVAVDESVRLELQKKGLSKFIKTTCICPYFINTGMFDGAKKAWPFYILSPTETVDRIIAAIR
jgi:all-trans-retinol dehydrogenase (NAD+)